MASSVFPFVYLGTGRCRDSEMNHYPRVQSATTGTKEDPQPCFDFCLQANPEKLVGVTLYHLDETNDNVICECQLTDADEVQESQYTSYDDSTSWVTSEIDSTWTIGTGNVEGRNGQPNGAYCFVNQVSSSTMFESIRMFCL